ncbi:helix-turn-helix domain-containing protein [Paenibacillus endoradicis]|uniref:helix-turn-helix domain-containing protein n=1 Tax=Paenibacillus endoradicis TaxID=2972487 RepID=UPI002159A913|nr:XRE family transcriptional regulator [Paenibacillus endoradicis]MCR8656551.1 XRE family transcriptional regulator [Paenibacillus endoradicis]
MELGRRIRLIRKEQKRTQEDIALIAGITKSMLSKIESGGAMPAVATLMKIATALGVRTADLLEDESDLGTILVTKDQYDSLNKWIDTNKGYSFFPFAPSKRDKLMQPYLFRAYKGTPNTHTFSHLGEEFIYVISGEMNYQVGNIQYRLTSGDTLYFNSMEEHRVYPISEEVVYLAIFTEQSNND